MTGSDTLRLEMVSPDDTPAMADLWFAAFEDNADIRRMWPDTPGMRRWWADANCGDMLKKPFQRYVKVVDPGSEDAEGRPRIAAYAKWDLSMIEDRGDRYPPWHEDMPAEENDAFFAKEDAERKRVMGDLKHYYLDTLATHPDYQRRGVGSMLVKWGCDLADKDGVAAYVDGTKAGAALYKKFGFVDESEAGTAVIASMAREVKSVPPGS